MEHDKVYIYGLIDPRDKRVRYIGSTVDVDQRLMGHLCDSSDTPKTRWLAHLAEDGLQPSLCVLDVVDVADRYYEEVR